MSDLATKSIHKGKRRGLRFAPSLALGSSDDDIDIFLARSLGS